MDSSFTVQLFDLLVYILPGLILFSGLWLFLKGKWNYNLDFAKAASLVYILLIAFLFGVFSHVISGWIHGGITRKTSLFTVSRALNEFPELELAKRLAAEKLHINSDNPVSLYFYAKTYVQDKLPGSSSSIARLTALSIFCRNSAFPILVFAAGAGFQIYKQRRAKNKEAKDKQAKGNQWVYLSAGLLMATISIEILLLKGMMEYTSATVHATLRAFITLLAV